MSALISGVKNFVSIAKSLVRALPFSQVKSANAKGSAFCGGAALACSCDFVTAAATVGLAAVAATGATLGAFAEDGCAGVGCAAAVSAAFASAGLLFASSSATRFSS